VTDAANGHMPTSASNYITRYWVGAQTGLSSLTYGATFTYVDADVVGSSESGMSGKRYGTGLPWQTLDAVNAGANTFTGNGLTEFSEFTAFDTPLAAPLTALAAIAQPGRVAVTWETVHELGVQGYAIYRTADAGSAWTRLNATTIPSAAPGSSAGYAYRWTDATATRGHSYWYRVVAVGLDGVETPLASVVVTTPYAWHWLPALAQ
jgi:hypothetical protein